MKMQEPVSDPVAALVIDLLEWLGTRPRPYGEVMEAWRTSCPRLPVWETANELGLVERCHVPGLGAMVSASPRGRALLAGGVAWRNLRSPSGP